MPATCPNLNIADWQEMNQSPLDSGGWMTPTGLKHLYVCVPGWPEVFILWDGNGPPPPHVVPHPYEMAPDEWVKVVGGLLIGNLSWIIQGGQLLQLLAVDLAGQHKVMVAPVK